MKKEKLLKGGGNLHIEVENGKVKAIKRYMQLLLPLLYFGSMLSLTQKDKW